MTPPTTAALYTNQGPSFYEVTLLRHVWRLLSGVVHIYRIVAHIYPSNSKPFDGICLWTGHTDKLLSYEFSILAMPGSNP